MYRKLLSLFLVLLLLSACTTPAPPSPDEFVDGYLAIIDTLYNEDTALNGGIKYIAVDTSTMGNLDRTAKDKLLKSMEKYGCTVLEDSLDGLKGKGYIKDVHFEEGILFILKDKPLSDGVITIIAEKWRSGTGAIQYTFDLKKSDGAWRIDKKYGFSIS